MNIQRISKLLLLFSCIGLLLINGACTPPPAEPTKKPLGPGEAPDQCPSSEGPVRAEQLDYANLPFYNELSRQFPTPDDCIYSFAHKSLLHNLQYRTESQSGRTRADGGFYHLANETVTFYVGDIEVGSAELQGTGSHIITPLEMAGPDGDAQQVENIARFLETMDSNGHAHPNDGNTYINEVLISDGMHDWGEGKTLDFTLAEAQFEDAYELLWTNDPAPGVVPPVLIGTIIYSVGDTGPAGGVVIHTNDGGLHGLEASPEDQTVEGTLIEWGCYWEPQNTSTIIGAGAQNTKNIIAYGCMPENPAHVIAAEVASAYELNGFQDWYLPSRDELVALYYQRAIVPGFETTIDRIYWSSTDFFEAHPERWRVYIIRFTAPNADPPSIFNTAKNATNYLIRAVRAF